MRRAPLARFALRVAIALCVTAVGAVHAVLYGHGYRAVPTIGPSFLVLAAASFAVGLLVLVGAPAPIRALAGLLALGALFGFLLSRTVGVAGFTERGLDPSPEAVESLVAEVATVVLVAVDLLVVRTVPGRRAGGPSLSGTDTVPDAVIMRADPDRNQA